MNKRISHKTGVRRQEESQKEGFYRQGCFWKANGGKRQCGLLRAEEKWQWKKREMGGGGGGGETVYAGAVKEKVFPELGK